MTDNLFLFGAGAFGALIGWYVYYVNRYRKGDVQMSDITTLVGVIGGGAVLDLFRNDKVGFSAHGAFGAYGIGLFIGFFGYLIVLVALVRNSHNFNLDFFLDGRRKKLADDETIPGEVQQTVRPMSLAERVSVLERVQSASTTQQAYAEDAGWAPSAAAQRIIDVCEASWDDVTKADCNKYAKAVLKQFGLADFSPGDDANAIAAKLADETWRTANKWTKVDTGASAKVAADGGKLVVGAITGGRYVPPVAHGHVVVVVSSEALHRNQPYAYWGKLLSVGEKNAPVTQAFNEPSLGNVVYAAKNV